MIKAALLTNPPERVFESLYRRHVKDVYRYSLAMLDRQADAEDVTQTTFMNAYRALERGERPRNPGAWLKAIALNVCRAHYRHAGRRPDEISLEEDPGELVVEPSSPEIGDVVRGLSCLPFNQRAALVMREFEGRSLKEIAVALEVTDSAVEALLFRARRALREQLEEKLTCAEAERAISRQLDGALARSERGRLRAHLRECGECASLAKRVRAQRSAIRSLALIPLPASLKLGRLFGGGASATAGTSSALSAGSSTLGTVAASVAGKVAVVAVAGVAAVGAGYEALPHHAAKPKPAAGATEVSEKMPALGASAGVRQHRAAETRNAAVPQAGAPKARAAQRRAAAAAGSPAAPGTPAAMGPGRPHAAAQATATATAPTHGPGHGHKHVGSTATSNGSSQSHGHTGRAVGLQGHPTQSQSGHASEPAGKPSHQTSAKVHGNSTAAPGHLKPHGNHGSKPSH